ncbi:MAG: hypothetical protein CMH39_00305 [Micrococcales bacterium]|nr:hypothetical protein [Micrococcales bacterium]|tara:strand:- start:391 stop:645 length:255 start_codon:yes stop_codon:yes gene_type:complete
MPAKKTSTRKSTARRSTARRSPAKKPAARKSRVNEAGNYTKPTMRKRLFESIKAGSKGGKPGQWSARKAQMLAVQYKKKGGGYK